MRFRFSVMGSHSLLNLVRDNLILSGHVLVPLSNDVHFVLVGCKPRDSDELIRILLEVQSLAELRKPILALSTSSIYADRDLLGKVLPKGRMNEADPFLFNTTCNITSLYSLLVESELVKLRRVMVLRPFNVYGPSISRGAVFSFIQQAKQKQALTIHNHGFQVRTFLYEEDFIACSRICVQKLVNNRTFGFFNVGSAEETNINCLANTVWQLVCPKEEPTIKVIPSQPSKNWKIPDLTRVYASTRWKSTTSLRKGIWLTSKVGEQ